MSWSRPHGNQVNLGRGILPRKAGDNAKHGGGGGRDVDDGRKAPLDASRPGSSPAGAPSTAFGGAPPPRFAQGRTFTRGALLAAAFALGGCIQPMYGQFAAGGPGLQSEMQAIAIEPIPNRIGHYLGDDLVQQFNGTGSTPTPRYRLYVALNEGVQTPLIDTVSGRASSATVVINADYRLVDIATGVPITSGKAFVMKSYDRTSERFSNIRAARDAEIHDAQQLADQLRIRIGSALADHIGVAARS